MTTESQQEVLRAKVNLETASIPWKELQRYFASGVAIWVCADLDLVEVAFQISEDNGKLISTWLSESKISTVSDEQAAAWHAADADMWAVVVSPYVLIQEKNNVLHS
ncbi:MAG: DUF2288 domain-containing protein [Gallionellaceae bacterium]